MDFDTWKPTKKLVIFNLQNFTHKLVIRLKQIFNSDVHLLAITMIYLDNYYAHYNKS